MIKKRDKTIDDAISIKRLIKTVPKKILAQPITITMAAIEFAGLEKVGGLGEVLEGLSSGLKAQHPQNRIKLVFPKYKHLPQKVVKALGKKEIHKNSRNQSYDVYFYKFKGIECYFIDHPSFTIDQEKSNIYGHNWSTQAKRFAWFSDLAADLIYEQKDTDVIHLHDWHVAGIALKLKNSFQKEWEEGQIPPIVFTFHTNKRFAQGRLVIGPEVNRSVINTYKLTNIAEENENIFVRILMIADAVTTVSNKFAIESQHTQLGEGISLIIKEVAKKGKLTAILNGINVARWDPEHDLTLKKWKEMKTKKHLNLSYSHKHPNILQQKQKCKEELHKWLEKYFPEVDIDLSKPLVTYIGRFDSYQKGLDKLDEGIRSTLKNGGQFICMGTREDVLSATLLDSLEKKYKTGVVFLRDYKDDNGRLLYQQGNTKRPGIGSLVRAATDFLLIPSRFEPCGMVQFEGWLFGSLVIGSNTGGLADTIIPLEKGLDKFNGFLFERKRDPANSLSQVIRAALKFWMGKSPLQKTKIIKRIMKEGKRNDWSTTPHGLSAAEKYRLAYEHAKQRKIWRKTDEELFQKKKKLGKPYEDVYLYNYYLAFVEKEELKPIYSLIPEKIRLMVPPPE